MIFITIGTTNFPFYRMIEVVKQIVKMRENSEKIIFQHGKTPCILSEKNLEIRKYIPYHEMERYIKQARIVVSHGGPATIFQALENGKTPRVMPRLRKYNEHVNDHQLYYCKMLEWEKRIVLFTSVNQQLLQSMERRSGKQNQTLTINPLLQYLDHLMVNK